MNAHCAWLAFLPGAVLAEATDDIRDIREPKAVPQSWVIPAVLVAAIVVACCAYVVWRGAVVQFKPDTDLIGTNSAAPGGHRPLMRPDTARAFGILHPS